MLRDSAQAIDPTGSLRLRLDAYRIQDIAASVLDRVLVESLLADPAVGAESSPITISGHRLTKVEYPEAPPTYFFGLRDVVYVIQTTDEGVVGTIVGLLE